MPDTNSISVQLTVDADGLVTGLKVAGKSVDGAAQAMRQSFKQASEGSDGLSDALREFKNEATQSGRVAGFFARDIAEIVPAAANASDAFKGLISAALGGASIGSGIEVALVAIKAFNEALQEQKKLAIETSVAHIEAGARVEEIYRRLNDSLDGNKTHSMAAASEIASTIRTAAETAAKANVTTLKESSEGWETFLNVVNSVAAVFVMSGVRSKASGDKILDMASVARTSFQKVTDNAIASDAAIRAADSKRPEAKKALLEEDEQLEKKNAADILVVRSRNSDAITELEAKTQAELVKLRLAVPTAGPGRAEALRRELEMEKALIADEQKQIGRIRAETALAANERLITLADQFATEDIKIQDAANIKAAQLRLRASYTTDLVLRASMLAAADTEVAFAAQTAQRVLRARMQGIEEAFAQTKRTQQAADQEALNLFADEEQKMSAMREANGNREIGTAIARVRKQADERAVALNQADERGFITHAQFLSKTQANEKTTADEIQQIWIKEKTKTVEGFIRPLESGFASMAKSMINGTKSVGDALKEFGTSILGSVIDGIVKVGATWITQKIASILATQALTTAEMTGAAQAAAANKTANISSTQANIATAMSGAASAMASIPFVGPELAVAAALAMFGFLEGTTAPLFAAASGGYDIPAGVNPVVQAHAQEMILPKSIANPLRQSLSSGGGLGGDTHHWHITTMDAASFGAYLSRPDNQRQIRELVRSNRWAG